MKKIVLALLFSISCVSAAWAAAVSSVDQLVSAVEAASAGDEILVEPGEYAVGLATGIVIDKAVSLRGDGGLVRFVSGNESISNLLTLAVAAGEVSLENIAVSGCIGRGFHFSGGANVSLANCRFEGNGTGATVFLAGRGAAFEGDGNNTVSLTDCVFEGNILPCNNSNVSVKSAETRGLALFVRDVKGVTLTNTQFNRNGAGDGTYSNRPTEGAGTAPESPDQSVVCFENAPVTAEGVRFFANRVGGYGADGGRLVLVKGASGGSVFRNCEWAANDLLMSVSSIYARPSATRTSSADNHPLNARRSSCQNTGSVVLDLANRADTVRFENCTFAYNITGSGWTAGLNVRKGHATVTGSVFWGNVFNATWGQYADLFVGYNGRADLDSTLFGGYGGKYFPADDALVTLGEGMIYGDPAFATDKATFLNEYVTWDNAYNELNAETFPFARATGKIFSDTAKGRGNEVQIWRANGRRTDSTATDGKVAPLDAFSIARSKTAGAFKETVDAALAVATVDVTFPFDLKPRFTVATGAGDYAKVTCRYSTSAPASADDPASYANGATVGAFGPNATFVFDATTGVTKGAAVYWIVRTENAAGVETRTGSCTADGVAPTVWSEKTLEIAPEPVHASTLRSTLDWSVHYEFNSEQHWTGATKIDGKRAAEWYRHRDVAAWGRTYDNELGKDRELTPDWFALVKPEDGEPEGRPLIVMLHGRGGGAKGFTGTIGNMGSANSVYHTPTNFYGLALDCRENALNDFWWGAQPPATKEAGMTVGSAGATYNQAYYSFIGGATMYGELNIGPSMSPFKYHTMTCLDWCHRGEPPAMKRVLDTVEWAIRKYKIDRNRVYICGNSMGGQAALAIGLRHGEVFAAINGNVPATVIYAASQMGFIDTEGKDVAAESFVAPEYDPPVCVDWSGSDDAWSRDHDIMYRNMNRFRFNYTGWWGNYGHQGSISAARGINDHVNSFDWLSVRRDEAYPVFANATGNSEMPWPQIAWSDADGNGGQVVGGVETAAGTITPRDGSDIVGQWNSWFRWEVVEDSETRFAIKLWIASEEELPSTHFVRPQGLVTDVSPRRLQRFRGSPDKRVCWTFGAQGGTSVFDERLGVYTAERIAVTQAPQLLVFEPGAEACEHVWGNEVVVRTATCVEPGQVTRTCSECGITRPFYTDLAEHAFVDDLAVEPTCTETGLTAGSHCSVCGFVRAKQNVVPAKGHNYDRVNFTWDPHYGCETDGVMVLTCRNESRGEVCGDQIRETVKAHHDYTDGFCDVCHSESRAHQIETLYTSSDRRYVFVDAHRGAWDAEKAIPENSVGAVENAIRLGADLVEIDLKMTADGYFIMMHDNSVDNMVWRPRDGSPFDNINGEVMDSKWEGYLENAWLRKSRDVNEKSDYRIALWEDILDAAKDKIYIHVDSNQYYINYSKEHFNRLWKCVTDRNMQQQVFFNKNMVPQGVTPPADIRYFGGVPALKADGTVDEEAVRSGEKGYKMQTKSYKTADGYPDAMTKFLVDNERDLDFRFYLPTLKDNAKPMFDDESFMEDQRFGITLNLDIGYTEIMTDEPEAAIAFLTAQGRHTFGEPETDTRRRVAPLVPTNVAWCAEVAGRPWGAVDTADYEVVEDLGGTKPGACGITLRLKDPATTRWTDTTDGEKTVWYLLTAEQVAVPTIKSKAWTGKPQVADVPASDGYTVVQNDGGTDVGTYDVVLAPNPGYVWSDWSEETRVLAFEITQAANAWETAPSLASTEWDPRDPAPTFTVGKPKFGEPDVLLDGEPFGGTFPAKIGEYVLTVKVDATAAYTGLSEEIPFAIKRMGQKTFSDCDDFYGMLLQSENLRPTAPIVTGADVIHCFEDENGETNWVLVFSNTTERAIQVSQAITGARLLLVGGGGGAGCSKKIDTWQFATAGGGGGGQVVEIESVDLAAGTYTVTAGQGGAGSWSVANPGSVGATSSFVGGGVSYAALGGGGGGSATDGEARNGTSGFTGGGAGGWVVQKGGAYTSGAPGAGAAGGFAGGAALVEKKGEVDFHLCGGGGGGAGGAGQPGRYADDRKNLKGGIVGGAGVMSDIFDDIFAFGGGGAGGTHGVNSSSSLCLNVGPAGGGDSYCSHYKAIAEYGQGYATAGVNGLGGGGAGGWLSGSGTSVNGRAGGDGVVILRFKSDAEAPEKPTPVISGTITMQGWTEGGTASEPTGLTSDMGTIVYKYYSNADCTEALASKPSTADTYWVRGEIAEAVTWNAAVSAAVSFTIAEKQGGDEPEEPEEPEEPIDESGFLTKLRDDARVIEGSESPYATGGDLVLKDGDDYIHVFYDTAAAGSLTVKDAATADILVVGGGACGGSIAHTTSIDSGAGGGGAGGVTILSATELAAGDYAVTVGAGGKWADAKGTYANGNGKASSFGELATAHGGGIGARYKVVANGGVDVACGGGGNGYYNNTTYNKGGATAYSSEGYAGGDSQCNSSSKYAGGGGGGGAGAVGGNGVVGGAGGAGGSGRLCAILGGEFSEQYFGGGGGGASVPNVDGALGGIGGGGKAGTAAGKSWTESCVGEAGENGLGGGGGAGCGTSASTVSDAQWASQPSGDGGSGIVIVRIKGSGEPEAPKVVIDGKEIDFNQATVDTVRAGETMTFGSAPAVAGQAITFAGTTVTVADYYDILPEGNAVTLEITADEVRNGSKITEVGMADGEAGAFAISLPNMKKGLWYAAKYADNLGFTDSKITSRIPGDGESKVISVPCEGATQFHRIVISDTAE